MLARNLERESYPSSVKSPEIAILESPKTFSKHGSLDFLPKSETIVFSQLELNPALRVNHALEEAKFYTRLEMRRFISDINTYLSQGKTLLEAVSLSTQVFEDHIKSYDAEIIKQNPVLLHLNRFGIWNGEMRMLGNNGRPTVDGVSGFERKGAVKQASEKIEQFLLNGENNSFIVLMSPQGVSGYLDKDGRDVPHLNTQTMIFWKDQNGDLKGITLVTDLTVEQSEKVMEDLGAPTNFFSKKGSEMARVANIVENPVQLSLPNAYKNPFEYVFDKIIAIRGVGPIRLKQKKGVELRFVEDMRKDIVRFENLLSYGLPEFREFILENPELVRQFHFQQAIAEKAEEAVLLLTREYLDRKNPPVFEKSNIQADRYYQPVRLENGFVRELAFLQTRAGCPAGLISAIKALGGSSLGSTLSSSSEIRSGTCSKCPRPQDGHYHCPSCNSTFEDESNKDPQDYTPSCGCGYVFGCGRSDKEENSKDETQALAKAA